MTSTVFLFRRFTLCRRYAMQSREIRHGVGSLVLLLELGVVQFGMFHVRNLAAEHLTDQLQVVKPNLDIGAFEGQRLFGRHDGRNVEFLLEDSERKIVALFSGAVL